MSDVSKKLRNLAELNFCENCYSKYLSLFQAEIERLLSEPIADWKQVEVNIDVMWIKAMNLYTVRNTTIFSPNKTAFRKAKSEKLWKKLKFLREKRILGNSTYEFLAKVSDKRNKIHPQYYSEQNFFTKQDYLIFRWARVLTDILYMYTIRDVKDKIWKNEMINVEKQAKYLLEKFQLK